MIRESKESMPSWDESKKTLKTFQKVYKKLMALRPPSPSSDEEKLSDFFYDVYMGSNHNEMIHGIHGLATSPEYSQFLLPSDYATPFGHRLFQVFPKINSRKDLWDITSELSELAGDLTAHFTPNPEQRTKKWLAGFAATYAEFKKRLSKYAKILQKYVEVLAPAPSSFSWKGFRIKNPKDVPNAVIRKVLDGVEEGLAVFKECGIEKLLYDELNQIIISPVREESSVEGYSTTAGRYRTRKKEIELKTYALKSTNPRLYTRWITEVFIHEFGHHIHLSCLPSKAKEFWDSGWAKVEEVKDKIEDDLEITMKERKRWLKIYEKTGYDLQKTGRKLDAVERLKYLSLLFKGQFFTVGTQARLDDKGKKVTKALQEGAADWTPDELAKYLHETPVFKMGGRSAPMVAWDIHRLGQLLGTEDYQLPPYFQRIEPNRLLDDYRESRAPEVQEALEALGIPSHYGKTNVKEDFAETFVQFVTAPWKLSETARWRMGRTLGMSDSLGTPIMKLTKRIFDRVASYRLSRRDKKVIEAFVNRNKAEGKLLSTDGRILHKHGLGSERVARWRKGHIAVLSSESVKSDDTILRYLEKVSSVPVRYNYDRDGTDPTITFKTYGDAGPDSQWDETIYAFVPEEEHAVGRLLWTEWRGKYFINMVEVEPEYRRMGIASALYKKLFKDQGITRRDLQPSMKTDDGYEFRRRFHAAKCVATRYVNAADDDDPFEDQCDRGGTCYQDAANYLLRRAGPNAVLVHGRPTLRVPPHIEYGHAWVEEGETVIDAATGTELPKAVYYAVGKIDPRKNLVYTPEETRDFMLSHGHYGPWEGPEGIGPFPDAKKKWLATHDEMPSRSKTSSIKKAKTYNRIVMFDFDGTLFRSWEQKPSWWNDPTPWSFVSHPASLDEPCIPEKPSSAYWINDVVSEARREGTDQNSLSVLVTGRLGTFKARVLQLLQQQGIQIDQSYFNPGMDAVQFKSAVLKNLLVMHPTVNEVVVWENDNVKTYDSILQQTVDALDLDVDVTINHVKAKPEPIMCGPMDFAARPIAARIARNFIQNKGES